MPAQATSLEERLATLDAARSAAEEEAEAERKRVEAEKAAKKAAKAAKKAEWKENVAAATKTAQETRDPEALQALVEAAAAENMLQQRYEDDTFVSVSGVRACVRACGVRACVRE